jgi:hypothetical protein
MYLSAACALRCSDLSISGCREAVKSPETPQCWRAASETLQRQGMTRSRGTLDTAGAFCYTPVNGRGKALSGNAQVEGDTSLDQTWGPRHAGPD